MSEREIYLLLALRCMRKRTEEIRDRGQRDSPANFLGRHEATLIDELRKRWDAVTERMGLPSPADIVAWL